MKGPQFASNFNLNFPFILKHSAEYTRSLLDTPGPQCTGTLEEQSRLGVEAQLEQDNWDLSFNGRDKQQLVSRRCTYDVMEI